ncbi:MAG TPA: PadR family transcriptional regulator [Chromatiales bacterium]|nr:PadR family transcriptional regulator [Chromatiales bacterium]
MDVKTLCLGLLTRQPASGYDLKKEFESLFKHFFPAGYGSIYPALADLHARGLVECEQIPQSGKPDRKLYRITEQGRSVFADALHHSTPQHKLRSEFLATMYFADQMEPERLRELLQQRIDDLSRAVEHLDRIQRSWEADTPRGARFVAGFGSTIAEAALEYIQRYQSTLTDHNKAREPRRPKLGPARKSLEHRL